MKSRPYISPFLFIEDECLRHDRDYPGIRGWWEQQFPGREFRLDWDRAIATEQDHGDHFTRSIPIDGWTYVVVNSFDGYAVCVPAGWTR
jgi:hypothetical protein